MAILARVLMLAACVPLLQPTGFCACRAAGPQHTSWLAQEPDPAQVTRRSSTPRPTGCCSHRHAAAAGNKPAAYPDRPAPQPCPEPADGSHLPGCPASVGADRFMWVEPAQSPAALPPPGDVTYLFIAASIPAAPPAPTSVPWPSSPPLYLTHCAFVI